MEQRTLLTAPRIARAVVTVALAAGVFGPATPAHGSKLDSDRIAGIRLSEGSVPKSLAPDVSAASGHLVASGGPVLWARRDTVARRMASTTKVMTALIVLETCALDETVKITKAATRTPYRTGLRAGERRSVRKLLELLLVHSSNDAATALAIHAGGSVTGFSAMMNSRALEFGLTNTHYVNPHGLDQKGQYSSAADLARLMRKAVKYPEFKRIIKLRTVTLPAYKSRPKRTYRNTNTLLGKVEGLRGGKTGYTNDAGFCFVASARRDGVTLTSVVLDSPSSWARFNSSKTLLNWGFKHYRIKRVASAGTTITVLPISTDPSRTVAVKYAETTSAALFDLLPVVRAPSLPTSITPPVTQGQVLGTVTVSQNGSVITTLTAVAADTVDEPGALERAAQWLEDVASSVLAP